MLAFRYCGRPRASIASWWCSSKELPNPFVLAAGMCCEKCELPVELVGVVFVEQVVRRLEAVKIGPGHVG